MMKNTLLTLALCGATAFSAAANDLDEVVQIEVLDGGPTERGTHLGAIRLTLKDGWKTYWRAPGDAGIPPQFDWRGSRNVGAVAITWPTPDVFDQNGLRSVGYSGQLVLPVEITPRSDGEPVQLKGRMAFGVCKDVCIPAELPFASALSSDSGRNPAIAAALAQRPYSAREAGVTSATCTIAPTKDGMKIEARIAMPSAGADEFTVIEPGDPTLWAAEAETRRQGDVLVASTEIINGDGGPFALNRSNIRITVLGSEHAVDIRGCKAG